MRALLILVLSFFSLILGLAKPTDARADAEAFTAAKCNKCHEISALKIAKDTKAGGDEEEEEEDEKSPDLSHSGKEHDAAFFKSFLAKEAAHVAHEGNKSVKKHPKKFKGSDEELTKMAAWIATLK